MNRVETDKAFDSLYDIIKDDLDKLYNQLKEKKQTDPAFKNKLVWWLNVVLEEQEDGTGTVFVFPDAVTPQVLATLDKYAIIKWPLIVN